MTTKERQGVIYLFMDIPENPRGELRRIGELPVDPVFCLGAVDKACTFSTAHW
jgi:hypothetical protein